MILSIGPVLAIALVTALPHAGFAGRPFPGDAWSQAAGAGPFSGRGRQETGDTLVAAALRRAAHGDHAGALQTLNRAQTLALARGDRDALLAVGVARAKALALSGRADAALVVLDGLASVTETDGATLLEAKATILREAGDAGGASEALREAIGLREKTGPEPKLAEDLIALAALISNTGPDEARALYERALPILERGADSAQTAACLIGLADSARNAGDLAAAKAYGERAYALASDRGGAAVVGSTLATMAENAAKTDNHAEADALLSKAVEIGLLHHLGEPVCQWAAQLGQAREDAGDGEAAAEAYRTAVHESERLHTRAATAGMGPAPTDSRSRVEGYLGLIRLALADGRVAEAFALSERMRARSLSTMLSLREVDLGEKVAPEASAEREAIDDEQEEIASRLAFESVTEDEREALSARLEELEREAALLDARIAAQDPRVTRLLRPEPIDAETLRAALERGTAFLSYVQVSSDELAVFAITKTGGIRHATIALDMREGGEWVRLLRERIDARDPSATALLREAYDTLIAPISADVRAVERLIVCPDASLHYVPFAALVDADGKHLVERMPVSLCASATVYSQLAASQGDQTGHGLLALGDPVYDGYTEAPASVLTPLLPADGPRPEVDRRTPRPGMRQPGPQAPGERRGTRGGLVTPPGRRSGPARRSARAEFARLPYTGAEATWIADLYAPDSQVLLGATAAETTVRPLLRERRYIHIAAHGWFDPANPTNSALVLSYPGEDAQTAGSSDGFLRTREIFALDLDADLVTLSACSTALGGLRPGEGIIGMTQAFLYAGSPSVIASLWNVDDYATAHLMVALYEALNAGAPKDEALRQAMLSTMAENDEWRAPHYWAAFQLYGVR